MNDLISRQAAIEHFTTLWECIDEIIDKEEWEDVCKTTANEIPPAPLYTPDEIQTMQDLEWSQMEKMYELGKAERKKGKWIADVDRGGDVETTVNGYICSECKVFNTDKDNYCPNCGCQMNGGEQDETD